ncbi:MAG: hypothetical protein JWQ25_2295, partial [Daejeonella sp.]|nr:hypothetical protein [Daejeonella sp.]
MIYRKRVSIFNFLALIFAFTLWSQLTQAQTITISGYV